MAIPSVVQNLEAFQGNGQVSLSWTGSAGASYYQIQRSLDGVNYSNLATSVVNNYVDTTVVTPSFGSTGTQYWYQVAAVNTNISNPPTGTSPYSEAVSIVPCISGQMSLGEIRLHAQQRADRVNSNFLTTAEWNSNINQSMYELYDLMINQDPSYNIAPFAGFTSAANQYLYPLPDGKLTFTDQANQPFVAAPFYRLVGLDLGLQSANNAWVTVKRFNEIDRNKYVYPNSASTIYGVFNCQYHILGNNLQIIPPPSSNQPFRILYTPRLKNLIVDTDIAEGVSGWIEYVIVDAAIKCLQKEESPIEHLMIQKQALIARIEASAANRDVGQADTISDTRSSPWGMGPNNPFRGGW